METVEQASVVSLPDQVFDGVQLPRSPIQGIVDALVVEARRLLRKARREEDLGKRAKAAQASASITFGLLREERERFALIHKLGKRPMTDERYRGAMSVHVRHCIDQMPDADVLALLESRIGGR